MSMPRICPVLAGGRPGQHHLFSASRMFSPLAGHPDVLALLRPRRDQSHLPFNRRHDLSRTKVNCITIHVNIDQSVAEQKWCCRKFSITMAHKS